MASCEWQQDVSTLMASLFFSLGSARRRCSQPWASPFDPFVLLSSALFAFRSGPLWIRGCSWQRAVSYRRDCGREQKIGPVFPPLHARRDRGCKRSALGLGVDVVVLDLSCRCCLGKVTKATLGNKPQAMILADAAVMIRQLFSPAIRPAVHINYMCLHTYAAPSDFHFLSWHQRANEAWYLLLSSTHLLWEISRWFLSYYN